jgi:hypothetical protein
MTCPFFPARLIVSAFIAILFMGCVQTQVTKLSNRGNYDPIPPDDVTVYLTTEDIKGEFEKIGLIHAQGETSWTNEQQMIHAARKAAGDMGANGIVLGEVDEPSAGAKIAGAFFGTGTTRRGEVLAVYVYDNNNSGWIDRGNPRVVEASHIPVENSPATANQALEENQPDVQSKPATVSPAVTSENPPASDVSSSVSQQALEPVTKLPNFRATVQAARNYTDKQILDSYRRKFPQLKEKPDFDLIALIETKYRR